ncbi:hypothetical protein QJS04_geneDACA009418 [Acorus gramineus]|uniref:Phytocyanin domain-containing protein n=1 Tax=Acorus gramineus TaxID=55184 RepID=A0AAV9AIB7_ACOGR|nr:hypothetical protein QJS04_geneDACA009418 [Acorus gramineus]
MASKQMFVVVVLAIIVVLSSIALATEHVVGDKDGWKIGVNYTEWVKGKTFLVGDTLVFNYDNTTHNVFKVDGDQFKACKLPPAKTADNPLSSGHDVIALKASGKKWYICGTPGHCDKGMKLVINVQSPAGPAPTPAPTAPSALAPSPSAAFRTSAPAILAAASMVGSVLGSLF